MTAPNEPGHPGPGETPARRNGTADAANQWPGPRPSAPRSSDGADAPPRPQGAQRPAAPSSRPAEPPGRAENRPGGNPSPSPNANAGPGANANPHANGTEARLSRFIAGSSAAPAPQAQATTPAADAEPSREDGKGADAYASELPDLSRPPARGTQRTVNPQRPEPPSSRPPERRVSGASRARGPVRASMQIRRIDPWSALKVSLLLSIAMFFVWMIAVAFLYLVLGSMGVWSKLNSNVGDLLTNSSGAGELVSSGSIFGGATLIGLVNIVLLTAMATLGAVVYNLGTDVVGGVEVTLADRD